MLPHYLNRGNTMTINEAINKIDAVNDYLLQSTDDKFDFEQSVELLEGLFSEA